MSKTRSFHKQTGVLPIVKCGPKAAIVLITSRRQKKWILPKGFIERDMTPQQSALKEAQEEAGLIGTIESDEPIGSYVSSKYRKICVVQIYRMVVREILDIWPEKEIRARCVVGINDALKMLSIPSLCDIIRREFNQDLTSG